MNPSTLDATASLDTAAVAAAVVVGSLPRPCPICGADMAYAGAAEIELCGPPHVRADAWSCSRCAAVSTVPVTH